MRTQIYILRDENNEIILKQNETYSVIIVGQADNGRMNMDMEWYELTNKTD